MANRKNIPSPLRSKLLLANQHACCICGNPGVQIHHIDGNNSNNNPENLAVICLPHHNEATAPQGLTAKLRPEEIAAYKKRWEEACYDRVLKGARARTAFFMVDYKNAERIRQLFAQLGVNEYEDAYQILSRELIEETELRKAQGFDISIEPNLMWSKHVEVLLMFIRNGEVHPSIFDGAEGHPNDPLFPCAPTFSDVRVPLYDVWCQLMIRALIGVRTPHILNDLLKLDDPLNSGLSGNLVAFDGDLDGKVEAPSKWKEVPLTHTILSVTDGNTTISTRFGIKTHYVYSVTGAESLEKGRSSGLLLLRNFESIEEKNGIRSIKFSSTPLIIGSGGGKLLEIP